MSGKGKLGWDASDSDVNDLFPDRGNLFRGELGCTYRVMILDKEAAYAKTHFIGRSVRCLNEEKTDSICPACKHTSSDVRRTNLRFAMIVVVYRTKTDGSLLEPIVYDLKVWRTGPSVWKKLKAIHKEWGSFYKHDLKVECTNRQFQTMEIQLCANSLVGTNKELGKMIVSEYKKYQASFDPERTLGDVLTPQAMEAMIEEFVAKLSDSDEKGEKTPAKKYPAQKESGPATMEVSKDNKAIQEKQGVDESLDGAEDVDAEGSDFEDLLKDVDKEE